MSDTVERGEGPGPDPTGAGRAARREWVGRSELIRAADAEPFVGHRHLRWVSGRTAIRFEHRLTLAAIVAVLVTASPTAYDSISFGLRNALNGAPIAAARDACQLLLAALLAYGSIVYLLARIGYLRRLSAAADDAIHEPLLDDDRADDFSLVALVPSFQEEPHVIRRALMSAALQPHADSRVVLLIDDPPESPAPASLEAARALPGQIAAAIRPMRDHGERALREFQERAHAPDFSPGAEARRLAALCGDAAAWFETQARDHPVVDLADAFFTELIFRRPAATWRHAAARWAELTDDPTARLSAERLRRGYARLVSVFCADITSFERKRFVNLSHASNKSMNVNSYLGLLGGSYRREPVEAGTRLSPCRAADAELSLPDADFVLILDADTIVSADYIPKLMRRFREPDGKGLAVVQCPYSTFPGDRGVLQRTAGAQTDIQYLVHQGLTYYDATYWVGANALVRMAALRDLAERHVERGFEIVKFIRDRTLIEDTESTIDLILKGWRLFNHPERLAFSMTPSDFGSLLIQRRRWANGGLLIVPKLLAYLRQPGSIGERFREGFMRLQYLISLGPVSMALLVMLAVSFDEQVQTSFLLGTGLIYYGIYGRDLHLIGYRWHDIFRVIALNLMLIPVNIVGMLLSIGQAITGQKPRFGRTPKVHGRTRVPAGFVLAEFALLAIWCQFGIDSMLEARAPNAAFMFVYSGFLAYAIGAFIGYRNSGADLAAAILGRQR